MVAVNCNATEASIPIATSVDVPAPAPVQGPRGVVVDREEDDVCLADKVADVVGRDVGRHDLDTRVSR